MPAAAVGIFVNGSLAELWVFTSGSSFTEAAVACRVFKVADIDPNPIKIDNKL